MFSNKIEVSPSVIIVSECQLVDMELHLENAKINYMPVSLCDYYNEYLELYFASIRSYNR